MKELENYRIPPARIFRKLGLGIERDGRVAVIAGFRFKWWDHPVGGATPIIVQARIIRKKWQPMKTAPRTSVWVMVRLKDGREVEAHYGCDLSGEEQPAFEGWFERRGTYFSGVDPLAWRPL